MTTRDDDARSSLYGRGGTMGKMAVGEITIQSGV